MPDQQIIQALIARDNRITQEFFFVQCRPLFTAIIRQVFDYEVDYDEFVNELYLYLMENDAARLRQFEGRSSLFQWIKVTASLYGGIHYGTTPDKMYAYSRKYRDVWSNGADELQGTKKEVESIVPILREHNIKVQVFTSDTANEESFKALSGTQQNIIHIGTHGFYWTNSTAQKQAYFKQQDLIKSTDINGNVQHHHYSDPLNRCGLLFAGANTALTGKANRLENGVEDGVLTAKEISLMDLRGTDIIVLSACETGLGDVTGEGVFGLQRGFKMAEVRSILMSLWKVHDDATQLLITSFYQNYSAGQSKREALRNAQQEVRKNPNYQSPYYWAGFILLD